MDKRKYESTLVSAKNETGFWRKMVALSVVSNLVLAMFILTNDFKEKTIITPMGNSGICERIVVEGNDYNADAIECYAKYFTTLRLSFHTKTVQARFDEFLRYTDPRVYAELKSKLDLEVASVKRNQFSSVFYPMGIHVKKHKAIVTGELIGYVGRQKVSGTKKHYEIEFRSADGLLTIMSFKELAKSKAGKLEEAPVEEEIMVKNPPATARTDDENVTH